jgi:hypothetical protein
MSAEQVDACMQPKKKGGKKINTVVRMLQFVVCDPWPGRSVTILLSSTGGGAACGGRKTTS